MGLSLAMVGTMRVSRSKIDINPMASFFIFTTYLSINILVMESRASWPLSSVPPIVIICVPGASKGSSSTVTVLVSFSPFLEKDKPGYQLANMSFARRTHNLASSCESHQRKIPILFSSKVKKGLFRDLKLAT